MPLTSRTYARRLTRPRSRRWRPSPRRPEAPSTPTRGRPSLEGVSNEPLRCIGALIIDDAGRLFLQRRSANRRLFPNTWDIVGGHVEGDETRLETLHREVREETGWSVSVVLAEVGEHAYTGDDGVDRIETDYLIRVDGDLSRPQLEAGKHTEFRWITRDELAVLDENRRVDGGLMRRIVEGGFGLLTRLGL